MIALEGSGELQCISYAKLDTCFFLSLTVVAKTITVKMVESAGAISGLILFHEENETVSSAQVHFIPQT